MVTLLEINLLGDVTMAIRPLHDRVIVKRQEQETNLLEASY